MVEAVNHEEFLKYVATMKERTDIVDKLSKDEKLRLYSLGRQGKDGDNNDPKPGLLELKEKAKWKAWNKVKGKDQNEAKAEFLAIAKKLLGEWKQRWSRSSEVSILSFYKIMAESFLDIK